MRTPEALSFPRPAAPGVGAHDALLAWNARGRGGASPTCVTVLREGRKTAVYRLHGVGPDGAPVIAKRCRTSTAAVERVVYERALGDGFDGAVRYHGCIEGSDSSWLFLEDAAGTRLSLLVKRQRLLVARWLALLHLSARADATSGLPDGGAERYLAQLRTARQTIERGVHNPSLGQHDARVLGSVLSQLEWLESRWQWARDVCAVFPATLVHGDLQPKNLRVRAGERSLVAMDWETAGWGAPAADVALLAVPMRDGDAIAAYRAAMRERGGGPHLALLRELVEVGMVFRRIAEIDWNAAGLATAWPQRAMACVRVYHAALATAMRGGAWTR